MMKKKETTATGVRKKQIIESALECFTEFGYTITSMTDISRRSKASIGSIYHHFGSKDQLAAAIYLEGIRNYQMGLITAMEGQASAREGIIEIVKFHLNWVKRNFKWAMYLFQKRHAEFMGDMEVEFSEMNHAFGMRLAVWFEKHKQTGTIKKYPIDLIISILLGPCQEFSRQYIAGISLSDIDMIAGQLGETAWQSLCSDEKKHR